MIKLVGLIKYQYDNNLDYFEIFEYLLIGNHLIVLKNVPLSDYIFNDIINKIGVPIKEVRSKYDQTIFDVSISKQNGFFTSISNSNLELPLHTDCADFYIAPNCIALFCIEPAIENEGVNKFMFLSDFLKVASESFITELTNKKWKFGAMLKSILTYENSMLTICYDRITMESFAKLDENQKAELDVLDKFFKNLSFEVNLEKGDMVLFRNDLLLHGRGKFSIDSKRLIKRIRFNLKRTSPDI